MEEQKIVLDSVIEELEIQMNWEANNGDLMAVQNYRDMIDTIKSVDIIPKPIFKPEEVCFDARIPSFPVPCKIVGIDHYHFTYGYCYQIQYFGEIS